MKKFRFELLSVGSRFVSQRRWFLYHEDIASPIEVRSVAETLEHLPDRTAPALPWREHIMHIMRCTRDCVVVELRPWRPVEMTPATIELMGPRFAAHVAELPYYCEAGDLINGAVWAHVPGDSA